MGFILGFNAKLYLLTTGTRASWGDANSNGLAAGPAPAGMTEMSNVQDVKLDDNPNEANVTTRAAQGYQMTAPGLSKAEVTFKSIWDTTDTNLMALLKAKITRNTIAAAVLDGASNAAGSIGFWADFTVSKLERDESIQEAVVVDITLTPGYSAVPPQWVEVTSS